MEAKYRPVAANIRPTASRRYGAGEGTMAQQQWWERLRRWGADTWWLEGLAVAIAVASLGCIATILGLYNGQPLDSWSHTLSLNTALSVLGTVMEGFVLVAVASCLGQLKWLAYLQRRRPLYQFEIFDQASRGPWGAAKLLVSVGVGSLAAIGALTTILALPSDAFVQQSVSYLPWNVSRPSLDAWVPYANTYVSNRPDLLVGPAYLDDGPVTAAVYDGIFNANLSSSASGLQPTCPTGNCTSPPYVSLGMCHQCADVTASLMFNLTNTTLGNIAVWQLPNGHYLENVATGVTFINITSAGTSVSLDSEEYTANIRPSLSLNTDALNRYHSVGTISNSSIITLATALADYNGTHVPGPHDATAVDCTFFYCARAYTSFSTLHVFQENTTQVFDQPEWITPPQQPNESSLASVPLPYFEIPAAAIPGIGPQNLTFVLGGALQAIGSIAGMVATDEGGELLVTSDAVQGILINGIAVDQVNQTMNNIALAITNAIRQVAGSRIPGVTYATETHIVVQWLWLLLPLAVVLATITLFLATIWQSRQCSIPPWRNSVLATMAYGIYGMDSVGPTGYAAGNRTPGELEKWSERVDVQLQQENHGALAYHLSSKQTVHV